MKDTSIIQNLIQSVQAAKASLQAVDKWSRLLQESKGIEAISDKQSFDIYGEESENEKVLEGFFDGIRMISDDGSQFPIPANYASKSKLVEGDRLKLSIKPNGAFIFKQIEMIPRKAVTGKMILDGNQYKVLCSEREYNILYASVTFYKGKIGDTVTVLIPEGRDASWGAVDNIIPAHINE